MKLLTLFRHAKSDWDDPGLADHDRPLAPRGHRDAPRMGKRLARRELVPDLLLTSTALRARQTADYLVAALKLAAGRVRKERGVYLASPGELLRILAELDDGLEHVLLVGHNPGLTELANRLLPSLKLDNLPTAGCVAVDCDMAHWRDIDSARLRLRFYDFPKKPGADQAESELRPLR
jgi:phosphohistidine phosphatase